jgi:hypothetical protein
MIEIFMKKQRLREWFSKALVSDSPREHSGAF